MTTPTRESLQDLLHGIIGAAIIFALVTMMFSCTSLTEREGDPQTAKIMPQTDAVSFHNDIKPIFESICLHCHNGHVAAGDLDLRNHALAFRRSSNGPFIVPGHPERSKIFRMIRLEDTEEGAMPPTGHGLSGVQIALIKGWIAQGAEWPDDESGHLKATSGMNWRSQ